MISLLAFRPGNSVLHQGAAGPKLLAYLLFCVGQFVGGLPSLLASVLILLTLVASTKTRLSGLRSIAVLAAFVVVSHIVPFDRSFSQMRMWRGVLIGMRLLSVGAASHLLLATTRVEDIRRLFQSAMSVFSPRSRHGGLRFYLTVRILQYLTAEARGIVAVVDVRSPYKRPRPVKRTVAIGSQLIERAIPLSLTLTDAMEARGALSAAARPLHGKRTSQNRIYSVLVVLVGSVPLVLAPLPRILPDFSIF
mgnify:CR=1 FL=1